MIKNNLHQCLTSIRKNRYMELFKFREINNSIWYNTTVATYFPKAMEGKQIYMLFNYSAIQGNKDIIVGFM